MANYDSSLAARQRLNGIDSLRTDPEFSALQFQNYEHAVGVMSPLPVANDVIILARLPGGVKYVDAVNTVLSADVADVLASNVEIFRIGTVNAAGTFSQLVSKTFSGGANANTSATFESGSVYPLITIPAGAEWFAVQLVAFGVDLSSDPFTAANITRLRARVGYSK